LIQATNPQESQLTTVISNSTNPDFIVSYLASW
jgi:hypothetical protein